MVSAAEMKGAIAQAGEEADKNPPKPAVIREIGGHRGVLSSRRTCRLLIQHW